MDTWDGMHELEAVEDKNATRMDGVNSHDMERYVMAYAWVGMTHVPWWTGSA